MPKLFITDIDGTILKKGETVIGKEIRSFLIGLIDRGINTAVASGRSLDSVANAFGGDIPTGLYVISNDGALCTLDKKLLFGKPLSQSTCVHFFYEAKKLGSGFFCSADNSYIFGDALSFSYAPEFAQTGRSISNIYEICENIYKIGLDTSESEEKIFCPADARCAYNDNVLQEYVSLYANKGTALETLSQRLFCHCEDIFALGDGPNDICMLRKAKHSALIAGNPLVTASEYVAKMYFNDFEEVMKYFTDKYLNGVKA